MGADQDPLIPRPIISLISVLAILGIFFNMWLDSRPGDYDSRWAYFVLGALIVSAYGIDIGRLWRIWGGRDESPKSKDAEP